MRNKYAREKYFYSKDGELVIKIPEVVYEHILKVKSVPDMLGIDIVNTIEAVKNGTPLPKGHGRLIDADEIQFENNDFDTYSDYSRAFDAIDNAPTIIEADKESEE